MTTTGWLVAGLITAPLAAYILARVVATAWFRTRREHAHRLMRELKDEERNEDG